MFNSCFLLRLFFKKMRQISRIMGEFDAHNMRKIQYKNVNANININHSTIRDTTLTSQCTGAKTTTTIPITTTAISTTSTAPATPKRIPTASVTPRIRNLKSSTNCNPDNDQDDYDSAPGADAETDGFPKSPKEIAIIDPRCNDCNHVHNTSNLHATTPESPESPHLREQTPVQTKPESLHNTNNNNKNDTGNYNNCNYNYNLNSSNNGIGSIDTSNAGGSGVNMRVIETREIKIQFTEKQIKLIGTMSKISCLVCISLITTGIGTLFAILLSISGYSYYYGSISVLATCIDIATNAVCLLLQWPFADKWYQKLCKPCDNLMRKKCSSNVEKYIVHKKMSATVNTVYK